MIHYFIRMQYYVRAEPTGGGAFEHPKSTWGRFLCTKEFPMPENRPPESKWSHPDAVEVDEDYGKGGGVADGDYVKFKCPHCQHSWWSELPN